MTLPRFVLHGIGGVYNYGCEAIVRGTETILRAQWPDCRIVYLSWRPEEDRKALEGCTVDIWDHSPPSRLHPKRVLKAALRRAGLPQRWIELEQTHGLGAGDCILSIGGDIFTLGPGPYPKSGGDEKLDFPMRLMNQGCKFVLWGASVGPFEAWPACIPQYRSFLRRMDLIAVREPVSLDYLHSLEIRDNITEMGDPAFLMKPQFEPADFPFAGTEKPVLGINLSPLSARHAYGKNEITAVRQEQAELLAQLVNTLGAKLLLIPHVIAPFDAGDDDHAYLKALRDRMPPSVADHVALLPPNLGARRTKGVIGRCDAILAARMHCAIAAVSQGVPALFLSYSAKASGMARLVYGMDKYCIPLNARLKEDLPALLGEMLSDRKTLADRLDHNSAELGNKALGAGRSLCDIMHRT